jgi:hypothetical protein
MNSLRLALRAPEGARQDDIRAERDEERGEGRHDRPDPEREKQELPVLGGRPGRQ